MVTNLRADIVRSLKLSMDVFPEGTALYNNTKAALTRVDTFLSEDGTEFVNAKMKRGVLMILDETMSYLNERENTEFVNVDIMLTRARIDSVSPSS